MLYLYTAAPEHVASAARRRAAIRQLDERFVLHVLHIMRGTTVDFPNDVVVYHSVFSCLACTPKLRWAAMSALADAISGFTYYGEGRDTLTDLQNGEIGLGWRFTPTLLMKASYRADRWVIAPDNAAFVGDGRAAALQASYGFERARGRASTLTPWAPKSAASSEPIPTDVHSQRPRPSALPV